MPIKLSKEEALERFTNRKLNLLDEYTSSIKNVTFSDEQGYKYFRCPTVVFQGKNFDPFHRGNIYTIENIKRWIIINNYDFMLLSERYYHNKKDLLFLCTKCNKEFSKTWVEISKHPYCVSCNGFVISETKNLLYNFPETANEFDVNKNDGKTPDNIYPKSHKRHWWKCKNCDHSWIASVISRTYNKSGCPACAGVTVSNKNNMLVRYPEISKEWHNSKNGSLKPLDILPGRNKNCWWICSTCNHEWQASPNKRCYKNYGCPICSKSKGEKKIIDILRKNEVKYQTQYVFENLVGDANVTLKFDIAVFSKNNELYKLIEFDGEFHYKKIYENDKFDLIQKYDKRKNKFCKANKIPLLRIPYWELDNVEEILKDDWII